MRRSCATHADERPVRSCCPQTPIQNNMQELWTLLNFINPDIFDSLDKFMEDYGDIKSKEKVDELHETIRPYILRRLKEDVEKSVPPKEETLIEVELTVLQKQYYRALYEKNLKFLHRNKKKPLDGPSINNLAMQVNHTTDDLLNTCVQNNLNINLLQQSSDSLLNTHTAAEMLQPSLPSQGSGAGCKGAEPRKGRHRDASQCQWEVCAAGQAAPATQGRRPPYFTLQVRSPWFVCPLLVVHERRPWSPPSYPPSALSPPRSQFKIMLDIIEDYLHLRGFRQERIDGSITGMKRQAAIDRFQAKDVSGERDPPFIMLLSTRAGGVGINLTAADTCVSVVKALQ